MFCVVQKVPKPFNKTKSCAHRLFAGAQANGQQAVEVIKLFQDVVSSITEAESTSQAASSSIQTTLQYVNTRTLEALQSDAQQSKDDSVVLEIEVTSRSTDVAGENSVPLSPPPLPGPPVA